MAAKCAQTHTHLHKQAHTRTHGHRIWQGRRRVDQTAVQNNANIFMCIFSAHQCVFQPNLPTMRKRERDHESGIEVGRVPEREGGCWQKSRAEQSFSRDHSPKTAGDVDAHKTTNPRHKHTKKPKENPPVTHTHTHIRTPDAHACQWKMECGKVLQCNFPAFCFWRPTQTQLLRPKGKNTKEKQRKKGQSGKLAQPEQQQQQHTFGTGCSWIGFPIGSAKGWVSHSSCDYVSPCMCARVCACAGLHSSPPPSPISNRIVAR